MKTVTKEKTLEQLTNEWKYYKEREQESNQLRLAIEYAIYGITLKDLKEEGTNNFPHGLKIVTGIDRKWDQDKVKKLMEELRLNVPPFKTEFKEDRAVMRSLEENCFDIYRRFLPALTTKPKKPSFSVDKE